MAASSPLIDGKKITDFKVTDLRQELDKRGLETKGLKADLVKRLEKVIEDGSEPAAEVETVESQPETRTSNRRSTPRRRSQKLRETKEVLSPEPAKALPTDGSEESDQPKEKASENNAANEQLNNLNSEPLLSDSLIVNTNDSVAQGLNTEEPFVEAGVDYENPDEFFQEDAYAVQDEGNQEEFLDQDYVDEDAGYVDQDDLEEAVDDAEGEYEGEEENLEVGEEEGEQQEDMAGEEGGEIVEEAAAEEESAEGTDLPEEEEEGDMDYEEHDQSNTEESLAENKEQFEEEEKQDHPVDATAEEDLLEEEQEEGEGIVEEEEPVEDAEQEMEEAVEECNKEEAVETQDEMAEDGEGEEEAPCDVSEGDVPEKLEDEEDSEHHSQELLAEDKPAEESEEQGDAKQAEGNAEPQDDHIELSYDGSGIDLEENEAKVKEEAISLGKGPNQDGESSLKIEQGKEEEEGAAKESNDAKDVEMSDADKVSKETTEPEEKDKNALDAKIPLDKQAENPPSADQSSTAAADVATNVLKDEKIQKENQAKDADKDSKKDIIRSIWISGLSSVTRAADLKTKFSQHGKVVGAKVVTSARSPGTHCFGFVTMSSSEEAAKCIEQLNKAEVHGKVITVEWAKNDPTPKKPAPKPDTSAAKKEDSSKAAVEKSDEKKAEELVKSSDKSKKIEEKDEKRRDSDRSRNDSRSDRRGSDRRRRSSSRSRRRSRSRDRRRTRSPGRSDSKDTKKSNEAKDDKTKSSKNETEEAGDKKVLSLEELKKERQAKIEKERKLRDERKKKEREKERELREERRKAQEVREKERRERARKEDERMRREREKQREIEKERELRKRRERERLQRERREREKEREEKERLERERVQREARLERERLERERLQRERQERERLEKERLDRERLERERVERERIKREKEELERIKAERERLEKERLDLEKRYALKRAAPSFQRDSNGGRNEQRSDYFPEQKRPNQESSRGMPGRPVDFFGGMHGRDARGAVFNEPKAADRGRHDPTNLTADISSSRKDSSGHSTRDDSRRSREASSRSKRESSPFSYSARRAPERNSPISAHSSSDSGRRADVPQRDGRREHEAPSRDYRKVVSASRDERERSPLRRSATDALRDVDRGILAGPKRSDRPTSRDERRTSRDGDGIQFYDTEEKIRERPWLDSPLRNPPKTLNEILERAGVSGILGNTFESQIKLGEALSAHSSSRYQKTEKPDWREDGRREESRPGVLDRDARLGMDRSAADRHHLGLSQHADLSRRPEIDIGISRRAQELLAQAGLQESQRAKMPGSHGVHSRGMPARDMPPSRDLPNRGLPSRDSIPQRGYPQRGPATEPRDAYQRGLQRQDMPQRSFPPQGPPQQQGMVSRHQPLPGSQRPMSSQDNWNRGRPVAPPVGANFPMMSGSSLRGQHMQSRDMSKQSPQGHGIPSHVRRF